MQYYYIIIIIATWAVSLLRFLEASWVDPDTYEYARTTRALYPEDRRIYELVFSDEFEQEGRTFNDGSDPRWTALNKNDCELQLLFVLCVCRNDE
jgi:hypothetical protein